jgi:hypothetical protein
MVAFGSTGGVALSIGLTAPTPIVESQFVLPARVDYSQENRTAIDEVT